MVYVLLGFTKYEGYSLLGVYLTHKQAETAYEIYCEQFGAFNDFDVVQVEVGAAAEWIC